jgi:hypothetical protein
MWTKMNTLSFNIIRLVKGIVAKDTPLGRLTIYLGR